MTRRWSQAEKQQMKYKIVQTLAKYPDGLGARELWKKSEIGSFETLYKYLPELIEEGTVTFHYEKVGRGKPKKVHKLSKKGIAHQVEFRLTDYFERVRQTCKKNEQIELDNYAFSYAIYGIPKNLNEDEEKKIALILKKINSALIDLDELRHEIVNKEVYKNRKLISKIQNKVLQPFLVQNKTKKQIVIDSELQKEIWSFIPSSFREKLRLEKEEKFAILTTRGPSFIDEFSLRPENDLLWLIESVSRWDDEGIDFVIEQLARNNNVDQKAIDRIKKWEIPEGKITNYDWQTILKRLDDIPQIRERIQQEKESTIQSGAIKRKIGIDEKNSIIVNKEMLAKEILSEVKKELSSLR